MNKNRSAYLFPSKPIEDNKDSPVFEKLVTKEQLAETLTLSISYINKLMATEGLPYLKVGRAVRFRVLDVMAWLQKRSRP